MNISSILLNTGSSIVSKTALDEYVINHFKTRTVGVTINNAVIPPDIDTVIIGAQFDTTCSMVDLPSHVRQFGIEGKVCPRVNAPEQVTHFVFNLVNTRMIPVDDILLFENVDTISVRRSSIDLLEKALLSHPDGHKFVQRVKKIVFLPSNRVIDDDFFLFPQFPDATELVPEQRHVVEVWNEDVPTTNLVDFDIDIIRFVYSARFGPNEPFHKNLFLEFKGQDIEQHQLDTMLTFGRDNVSFNRCSFASGVTLTGTFRSVYFRGTKSIPPTEDFVVSSLVIGDVDRDVCESMNVKCKSLTFNGRVLFIRSCTVVRHVDVFRADDVEDVVMQANRYQSIGKLCVRSVAKPPPMHL